MHNIIIALLSVISGCTQAVTGFGAGIVNMLFLPYFMNMSQAAAVSVTATCPLGLGIAWRYRRNCSWNKLLTPLIVYIITCYFCVKASTTVDLSRLKAVFGIVLVAFGIYFLFISDRIRIKGGIVSGIVCGFLSGVINSFFGIGGPPLVVYFLAVTDSKEEYLGTINVFFALSALYLIILRVINGIITAALVPPILFVSAGLLIGSAVGGRIVDHINAVLMKKIIYIFLIISGIITTVNALI